MLAEIARRYGSLTNIALGLNSRVGFDMLCQAPTMKSFMANGTLALIVSSLGDFRLRDQRVCLRSRQLY